MRFGWKQEIEAPPPSTAWHLRAKVGQSSPPETYSLLSGLDLSNGILDQSNTSSCVAHAVAGGIRLRRAITESDYPSIANNDRLIYQPLPSRRWIYRLARETHNDADRDDGTYISAAFHVCKTLGFPDESYFGWSEQVAGDFGATHDRWINEPAPWSAHRHAFDRRDSITEYSILSPAPRSEITGAISHGYPIVCGAWVDEEFLDCRDWKPLTLSGLPLGGHAILLVGYDLDGVHVLNSWGPEWGFGGLAILSWQAAHLRLQDLRVITTMEAS